jgi:hypothetical protein
MRSPPDTQIGGDRYPETMPSREDEDAAHGFRLSLRGQRHCRLTSEVDLLRVRKTINVSIWHLIINLW